MVYNNLDSTEWFIELKWCLVPTNEKHLKVVIFNYTYNVEPNLCANIEYHLHQNMKEEKEVQART